MEWIVIALIGYGIVSSLWNATFGKKKITYTDAQGKKQTETLQKRQPREILGFEKPEIELTPEIQNILNKFENTKDNIFLTGKAGTGKSTLLRYFRATTNKNYAVVAPTGIAAINVQGQTIHSFFGFGIDVTQDRIKYARGEKQSIMLNLETLVIDEISMVRADLLDCINKSLQMNKSSNLPFGGVQIIAIGDPYQLPPVVKTPEYKFFKTVYKTPYFFSSNSYQAGKFTTYELSKIYRQSDPQFIRILNVVRSGDATVEDISELNSKTNAKVPHETAIKLVTTNVLAKSINATELAKIPSEAKLYRGTITGDFKEDQTPTDLELYLKEGARIMLLNNETNRRWVNGDIGTIIEIGQGVVKVKFDDNTYDDVPLHEWDNVKFIFDEEKRKILPEVVGKFIQLPIKLAWAVTIHKSQGMTYENVHIDFGNGTFAPGQAYVALSRCTSLDGLSFETPMSFGDVIVDNDVKAFMEGRASDIGKQPIKNINLPHETTDTDTISQISSIRTDTVDKSDINKLKFFVEFPEKYATGTAKAKEKVDHAKATFEKSKATFDIEFIDAYYDALEKYNKKLGQK